MSASTLTAPPNVRHEEFCQPTGGRDSIRIESYLHYEDNPETGRSRSTHKVTSCIECGARHYQKIGV